MKNTAEEQGDREELKHTEETQAWLHFPLYWFHSCLPVAPFSKA